MVGYGMGVSSVEGHWRPVLSRLKGFEVIAWEWEKAPRRWPCYGGLSPCQERLMSWDSAERFLA